MPRTKLPLGPSPRRAPLETKTDRLIADRIRAGRALRDMNQTQLGEALGVSTQQVQKYEAAENRVSGGRLTEIARALILPLSFFFEEVRGLPQDREGLQTVMTLAGRIGRLNKGQQRAVLRLVDDLTGNTLSEED